MEEISVLWLPALVAAIAAMVVGGLWYSQFMFGKAWMALAFAGQAVDKDKMKKEAPKAMGGMFIVVLISALIMAKIFQLLGVTDAMTGAQFGFWLGLGFSATTSYSQVLFARKPLKLYAINTGHDLVGMIVMGAVIGGWQF